jgi:hypothetical protein
MTWPRPVQAASFAEKLYAWDAGSEANQASAAGPDQAPRRTAPNTGAAEGNGLIRLINDPVWGYPSIAQVIRLTVTPVDP